MASIELSAVESFSRNWLVTRPEGSFRADDSNSFIEMDPKLPPSQRFFRVNTQDLFAFDFPLPSQSASEDQLVHADELIYNGYLMPLLLNPFLLKENNITNNTDQDSSASDDSSRASSSNSNSSSSSSSMSLASPSSLLLMDGGNNNGDGVHESGRVMRCSWCRKLSNRMLRKYLHFLTHFFQKIGGRSRNRAKVSTSSFVGYSPDEDWRRSCDSETSIYEAVLHCKRTIGN